MKTVSIGYYREDGDFAILSTFNNNDGNLTDDEFNKLIKLVEHEFVEKLYQFNSIVVLERQDTPDYITIEGEANEDTLV